ncbi:restriction endonuclease subunit S [Burkholderia multivorans]|nr:restriction endonuclease subunit S [Burkholderia multivorans]MDN7610269.1 restriction endonuclease subunit S [Burkholderia multivorans]MDN8031563.1 restriction endonuclease subunit S [Burkholderia multivorans]PRD76337.1 restriction endonuclease subunit S [Burkholderia multivorans]PRE77350.1 restriction endonuclease subunit S [Burkholderia multivorans]PRF13676.1 restriction endonuclease subunit S [Burkholderia multivorans]
MSPGYKQTEVGVIPVDWDVAELGECLVARPDYGINAPAVPYSDRLPMYIRITDITEDGGFSPDKLASVNAEYSDAYFLSDGDIVLARTGASVGKSYRYKTTDGPLVFAGFLIRVKPDGTKLLPGYVASYLKTGSYWRWVQLNSMRSGQPGINGNEYAKLPLPLPPLPEQSAIATALSDVDALLSSLDALIAKKRDIRQAVMQQLLTGKTRLPGFEGEWTVKRLDQLANIRSGGTPSTTVSRFWDGGIPWCTPTDITRLGGGKYLLDTSRQITSEGLSNSSAELIPANSVVMTSRATIGECAINLKPVTTNQGFKNFVPFEDTDVNFLYYLLQTQKQGFMQLCAGSTFLEIGKTQLAAYKVHLPSTKAEQTAIAQVLSDMDVELAALEARRDKTRLLKQGMMQELLTGKTRLV